MSSSQYDALDLDKIPTNPYCPHGPSILFTDSNKKKFFACSACRDHKVCKFYLKYQDFTESKLKDWHDRYLDHLNSLKVYQNDLTKVKELESNLRKYCHTCKSFIFEEEKHSKHEIMENIDDSMLKKPIMTILQPKVKNSANAQFLFDNVTFDVILKAIKKCSFDSVLCIGTPSVFERLQEVSSIKKLLMDIDQRFTQFYENDSFVHYNMFNNHFFSNKETYTSFLKQSKNVLLIIDPPYGGIVKLIANSIRQIQGDFGKDNGKMSTLLFYPYFTEMWVNKWLPEFKMIDYKVSYENHRKLSKNTTQKKGSTARIFTDIMANNFVLPAEEGYTYCGACKKYTFKENQHCKKCKACTSKDGGHYKHCNTCERCVKIKYQHCKKCNRCHLEELVDCASRIRAFKRPQESDSDTEAHVKMKNIKKK